MIKIPQVVFQKKAKEDVDSITRYIAAGSVQAANAFLDALEKSGRLLLGMPEMGSERSFGDLDDLRMLRIHRFEKYLIYYRPVKDGLEIVRILHGSRDIPKLFGE